MKLRRAAQICGSMVAMLLWIGCHTDSRQPTVAIPANQPPLLRVMPPTQDEIVPKGTEKVIVLSRKDVGGPDKWDFIACGWELIPSMPQRPITKRVEFAHSGGSPDFLFFVPPHICDDYVTVRVLEGCNLYRINYQTWEVKFLSREAGNFAYGIGGGLHLLEGRDRHPSAQLADWTIGRARG